MTRLPWFKFYPGDFMKGCRGLSAQEVGAYVMLLCRMYEQDGPIDRNEKVLAAYCGMRPKSFAAALQKLVDLGKISIENGRLTNDRAMAEIHARARDRENTSRAGKISARKRQQKQWRPSTGSQHPFNDIDKDKETPKPPEGADISFDEFEKRRAIRQYAEMIKSHEANPHIVKNLSPALLREILASGNVSEDQLKAAGLTW